MLWLFSTLFLLRPNPLSLTTVDFELLAFFPLEKAAAFSNPSMSSNEEKEVGRGMFSRNMLVRCHIYSTSLKETQMQTDVLWAETPNFDSDSGKLRHFSFSPPRMRGENEEIHT